MLGLLADVLERRQVSPYVQAFLRGDDMPNAWGSGGRVVSSDDSLTIGAVYACVSRITEAHATMPLHVYRRLQPRGRERAPEHPAYPLLHDAPNPEMSSLSFREAVGGHVLLRGNGFAEIQWDGGNRPLALWPLRPDRMQLKRDDAGQLWYVYTLKPGAEPRWFRPREILHFRGLSSNGLIGYSPIELAMRSLGELVDTEEFGARFWSQGSNPGGVLQSKDTLSDEAAQRMKQSWEEAHRGLENAWRVAVLEEGVTWQQVSIDPQSSSWLDTRKFKRSEVAGMFNVPAHKIGDLEHATFSNVEEMNIDWVVSTVRPWAVRFESEYNRQLVTDPGYYAEHQLEGLLRGDFASRMQGYNTGRMMGVFSANDIRELENMNPLPGEQGNVYWAPLNMTSAEDLANNETNGDAGQGARGQWGWRSTRAVGGGSSRIRRKLAQRYTRLFADAAQRVVARECNDLRAAAQRHMGRRDAASFLAWADDYERDTLMQAIIRGFSGAWLTYADVINDDARAQMGLDDSDLSEALTRFVRGYLESYASTHTARSMAQLRQLLERALDDDEDPLDIIDERLTEWNETRAQKIATVETNRLGNAVAKLAFLAGGVQRMVWSASGQACPLCQAMNGKTVSITGVFLHEGETLETDDADTSDLTATREFGHPPLHGACDCGIDPA